MLDEYHPTWVAKRSNNVRSNKVGVLNPTLFDSLARALVHYLFHVQQDNQEISLLMVLCCNTVTHIYSKLIKVCLL